MELNGQRITGTEDLNAVLQKLQIGDQVDAVIYRSRRQYTVTLTVEEAKN
jgi:S1-C subfamily serine protease